VVEGWEPGLRLLVENLLENAARHGRPGGRVRATLDDEGGALVLHVEDDGPGIAAADRRRVFEPFVRVHGEERPGSGLGLALVAQQARHHGAAVGLTESPLGGARVTVRFTATPY
jgi:signal transduction histidine kinase